jgi:hypothetical protein
MRTRKSLSYRLTGCFKEQSNHWNCGRETLKVRITVEISAMMSSRIMRRIVCALFDTSLAIFITWRNIQPKLWKFYRHLLLSHAFTSAALRGPSGKDLRRALHPIVVRIVTSMRSGSTSHTSNVASASAPAATILLHAADTSATSIESSATSLSNQISTAFRARNWPEGQIFPSLSFSLTVT